MIGQYILIALLLALLSVPILRRMYTQGTINIEKPEKRKYMFEDENGDRYNPFESPDGGYESEDDWKYSLNDF